MPRTTTPQRKATAEHRRQPEIRCCANCGHFKASGYWHLASCQKLDFRITKAETTAICHHWKKA